MITSLIAAQFLGTNGITVLVVVSMILAIVALIKPQWPLCAVAVLLLAVAMLAGMP